MTARKKASKKRPAKKKAAKKKGRCKTSPYNIPAMKKGMWKPGQSGNPKGRPPGQAFQAIFLKLMDRQSQFEVSGKKTKMTRMEMLARIIIDEAILRKDYKFIELMVKRLWPEGVEVNLNAGGGFTIVFDDQDRAA